MNKGVIDTRYVIRLYISMFIWGFRVVQTAMVEGRISSFKWPRTIPGTPPGIASSTGGHPDRTIHLPHTSWIDSSLERIRIVHIGKRFDTKSEIIT